MAKSKSAHRKKLSATERKRHTYLELLKKLPFYDASDSWWSLPSTGDYVGGCRAGKVSAIAFIKFLRECRERGLADHSHLQHIVLSMTAAANFNEAQRGQIVGFLSELDNYLRQLARLAAGLDSVSFNELRAQADAHLASDFDVEWRQRRKVVSSEASKRGWKTRRAKLGMRRPMTPRGAREVGGISCEHAAA